jgi:hypothetical protein
VPQAGGGDVVDERALAVDLDDGQPLAVASLELRVAGDVDLVQLEAELLAQRPDRSASPLAKVTTLGVVNDDGSQRRRLQLEIRGAGGESHG